MRRSVPKTLQKNPMKYKTLLIALISTVFPLLAADLRFTEDLERLQKQHDSEVASALEPIDRRYIASLEQLRRKAAQANDLGAANKIQKVSEAIRKPFPQAVATEFAGPWILGTPDNGWTCTIEFKSDGTFVFVDQSGTWEKTDKELKFIVLKDKEVIETDVFKLPVKDGKLSGIDNKGRKKSLARK